MAEQEQSKTRVFVYGDQRWDDPGAEYSDEEVRQQLTTFFPELARAEIKRTEAGDRVEVEFVKRAGTKGRGCR